MLLHGATLLANKRSACSRWWTGVNYCFNWSNIQKYTEKERKVQSGWQWKVLYLPVCHVKTCVWRVDHLMVAECWDGRLWACCDDDRYMDATHVSMNRTCRHELNWTIYLLIHHCPDKTKSERGAEASSSVMWRTTDQVNGTKWRVCTLFKPH